MLPSPTPVCGSGRARAAVAGSAVRPASLGDSGAKAQAYAITAERSGGSVQPTHPPLVEGSVQA